jgi:Flp pilus assembly protein TadG
MDHREADVRNELGAYAVMFGAVLLAFLLVVLISALVGGWH